MSGPVEVVLIVVAVVYVLVRRLMGEPAQAKRMLILPAVLSLVGLHKLWGEAQAPVSLLFLVATVVISIALGALRGSSVRISRREGLAFVRYTGTTVLLWLANVGVKFGADVALKALAPNDAGALGNSVLLTIGVGLLAEGLVVLYRALRSDHRVMWATGKDGAPHQMSPVLENLRRGLGDRANTPQDRTFASQCETRSDLLREHDR